MTSCCVTCSISSMREMSNAPRSRMSRAASAGTIPAAAMASAAAASTSNQVSYRRWSLQIRPISACVYLGIMERQSNTRDTQDTVEPFDRSESLCLVASVSIPTPLVQVQAFARNLQAVHVAEYRRRERTVPKQIRRHSLHVFLRHAFDSH